MLWNGSGHGLIEIVSWNLSETTKEYHENHKSQQSVSRLRFKPSTSLIQVKSAIMLICSVKSSSPPPPPWRLFQSCTQLFEIAEEFYIFRYVTLCSLVPLKHQ